MFKVGALIRYVHVARRHHVARRVARWKGLAEAVMGASEIAGVFQDMAGKLMGI